LFVLNVSTVYYQSTASQLRYILGIFINRSTISLHFYGHSSRWTWVSRYQNASILDFIEAKSDGSSGDNWNYKTRKAPVK